MLLRKNTPKTKDEFVEQVAFEETTKDFLQEELKFSLLESAIETLKEDQKECIRLFYLKELSYQQISDLLKTDLNQVKSAIQNGKRNLKLRLEETNEFKTRT